MSEWVDAAATGEVRACVEAWAQAVRQKDLEGVMAQHAAEVVNFDAWGGLVIDAATTREHWRQCFEGFAGPIGFELRGLVIVAGTDVAFCHCLIGMTGTLRPDRPHEFWGRGTLGLQRIDGRWLITHGHASAPFNPYTNEAETRLRP